ncbi:hypothetical protein EDD18DRAFT_1402895 [Armillaria luteobubalina]|uniref:Methyltransferase n=1 Tax=Armillaria luteobubalina TaxID=153913 RepID=A0AA39TLG8_9AGAR|nr:hypothetical protein EDD18DRAFT_1402895 [Armillaria luteobubalina]
MSMFLKGDNSSSPDVHYIFPSDALEKQLGLQHALIRHALCNGKLETGLFHLQKKFPPQFLLQQLTSSPKSFPNHSPQMSSSSSIRSQIYLDNGWIVALQELHHVITPGGWVQLVEGAAIPGHMGPFSEKISNVWSAVFAHKGLVVDVVQHLPDMLIQAGFINVWTFSAMRGPLFEGGGLGLVLSEQEYNDLIACVGKEWDNGREVSASKEVMAMYAQKLGSLGTWEMSWTILSYPCFGNGVPPTTNLEHN